MTNSKILVVAPHADDEILGVGGTIARFSNEKKDVYVAIMTRGHADAFPPELEAQVRSEAEEAHRFLGVQQTLFYDFPAAAVDQVPHREVNAALVELIRRLEPECVFLPFGGDIHMDHQLLFLSALVAVRPNHDYTPSHVYVYETLSETNWHAPFINPHFAPSVFIDISEYLEQKLQAFAIYRSQVKVYPHERSLEAVRALATLRGATVHRRSAEAFMLVRMVL